jgi:phosphatidylserine/phosphatidylglycerophosphate/cardiolipin synthase-like enzyme
VTFYIFAISSSKVYFMPQDSNYALSDLVKSIKKSKSNIKGAIYSFTHKKIAKAFKKAAQNGSKITIIFDEESNIHYHRSKLRNLAIFKNINTRVLKGDRAKRGYYGKMHLKFVIIDDKVVFFGSANWSNSAFGLNHEVLYKSNDKKLVNKFIKHYKILKAFSKNFK